MSTIMRRNVRLCLGLALAAGLVPYAVSATAAGLPRGSSGLAVVVTQRGDWRMNESPIDADQTVADTSSTATPDDGATPDNWSGSHADPLASTGTGSFYFPGWDDGSLDSTVDATASSFSIPDSPDLNPEDSDFQFQVYVKAIDPSADTAILPTDTLNIVQKGLSGPGRQQWKLSVFPDGRFVCTFRGPSAAGVMQELNVTSTVGYAFDTTYLVTCQFSPSTGEGGLMVSQGGAVDTYTAPAVNPIPFTISNSDPVTVGKKPDSTNAGDTFAGWLDNLRISKG